MSKESSDHSADAAVVIAQLARRREGELREANRMLCDQARETGAEIERLRKALRRIEREPYTRFPRLAASKMRRIARETLRG